MADGGVRVKLNVGGLISWPLTLVFGAMVFLSVQEIRRPVETVAPTIGGSDWTAHLPQRIDAITSALQRGLAHLPAPLEERQGSGNMRWIHRRYDVVIDPDQRTETEAFISSLSGIDPGVTIGTEAQEGGVEVRVGLDGLLTHTLHVRWDQEVPPLPPRVALIVDALGDDLYIARQFAILDVPVALAVRPFRPFSKEVAELGRLSNREVLLHLSSSHEELPPVETTETGTDPAAPGGDMSTARQAEAVLTSVPNAVGLIAESPQGEIAAATVDKPLLAELERRGLFRVGQGAKKKRAASARKPNQGEVADVITLSDGDGSPDAAGRLSSLPARARESGVVIAVTRPTPEALEALRAVLSEWQSAGIEIVPVSGVVAPVALSAR